MLYYNVFHFSIGCPRLYSPINGIVTLGANTAYYGCNSGYTLVGSSTRRTCLSGGYWSGSTPYCKLATYTYTFSACCLYYIMNNRFFMLHKLILSISPCSIKFKWSSTYDEDQGMQHLLCMAITILLPCPS